MIPGDASDLGLGQIAQREQGFGKRFGVDGVQKVALVFLLVACLEQNGLAVFFPGTSVVTRRQPARAQARGVGSKHAKLDFAIAQDVRVRRTPAPILLQEIAEYAVPVFAGEVHVVQRDIQLRANLAGVLEVLGGRAVAVVIVPVGHVQRVHVGALLL